MRRMLVTVRWPGVRMAPISRHLGMAPTPLEEQRRKAEDHFGEAGWQSEHGSGPVAGTPQPNRIPAPLLQARKWPNSSLSDVGKGRGRAPNPGSRGGGVAA